MPTFSQTYPQLGDGTMRLPDGRNLAYYAYGSPTGHPVLYFHGSQSSRLERHPDESIAARVGARIIAIDRPGHGLSDFQPHRRLLDWPDDVSAFADALGLVRFAVLGMSAGGPYVLACADRIPQRITHATIIASFAPQDQPAVQNALSPQLKSMFRLARRMPWLIPVVARLQRRGIRSNPEKALAGVVKSMSLPDQQVLAQPAIKAVFTQMFAEAYRLGSRGVAWELTGILVQPWGFSLQDVRMPVALWQGERDQNVPAAWGHYLAETLPGCEAHFLTDEGHLLVFNHLETILTGLLA